jgi:hypothetical protein
MKTRLLAVSISALLCACAPSADKEAVAPEPVVSADAPATADAAPAATTPTVAEATTPAAQAPATDSSAGDQAVNDSIDSNLGDHTKYQAAIKDLQAAVAVGDAAKVASLARYPFSVDIGGKATVLKNEQEFAARYKEFMTPDIGKAIVETKYADLFVNYKGVMFGDGQAWLNGICKDDQCKTFDVKLVTLQHGPD